MKRLTWCLTVVVALAVPFACHHYAKQPTFRSNFADIRIADHRIVTANIGEPFSGTLVARDDEIAAIAALVLRDMPVKQVSPDKLGGMILVVPVATGMLSGRATLYVDLRSPKLSRDITRRGDPRAVALARTVVPTIVVAEATFKDGKLDGIASVFDVSTDKAGTTKIADVELRGGVIHGSAIEYFPGTSQPKRKLNFERGTQSGIQRWFHANGKLAKESVYLDGKADGEVKEYFANGADRARSRFDRGKPVGKKQSWFPTGKRQSEVVFDDAGPRTTEWYSNGGIRLHAGPDGETRSAPEGLIEEYYDNGVVRSRARYVNGVQHGPFEMYYSNARKWKSGMYENGKQSDAYREWWKNGRAALECRYLEGKRDGSLKRWYANGTRWESAQYVADKPTGPYRKWWKNGAPAHVYAYTNGKLDGDYRTFYDSGAKWAVGSYTNGKPHGTMQRWFPDGRLGYIMHHTNGRPDGEYRRWYADGKPRLEAAYAAGHLDGDFKNWLEDGSVYELATYQRGVLVKTTRPKPNPAH
jgi:antitoxin component YwqK of YwqJK toxin-antitoxin module